MNKLLTIALISVVASAQTISGIAVDEKGAPLPDVRIDLRKITDANGRFADIKVPTVLRRQATRACSSAKAQLNRRASSCSRSRKDAVPGCTSKCDKFGGTGLHL
jgi:hypothetical protein